MAKRKESALIDRKYSHICAICGRECASKHHLIFGWSNREFADADGLWIPICDYCHNTGGGKHQLHENPIAEALSKMLGQMAYEKKAVARGLSEGKAREEFMKRYGRSWL